MEKIIKSILHTIENEGYEAYIVGGFVRDKLLGRVSYDVDICTNALPMEIQKLFNINQSSNGYGGFNLKIKKYNIDITTYRKERDYDKRHPTRIEYVSSLFEDIKRRDFTVNSLCMDKNGNIIDLLNGIEDLNNKKIKVIGNPTTKFIDDPLRMLRAIRFATELDFNFENKTYNAIKECSEHCSKLSSQRIKDELSKILSSNNYQKGLDLLIKLDIAKYIGISFKKVVYTTDILGMWAQIETKKINFTKVESDIIKKIKLIIYKGKINNFDLFNYGLYTCLVASDILGISRSTINKQYHSLPIKSMKDINICGQDIIDILNIEPCKKISEIINKIKIEILNNNLKNNKNAIKKYIVRMGNNEQRE